MCWHKSAMSLNLENVEGHCFTPSDVLLAPEDHGKVRFQTAVELCVQNWKTDMGLLQFRLDRQTR